jgi:hypothetical protein
MDTNSCSYSRLFASIRGCFSRVWVARCPLLIILEAFAVADHGILTESEVFVKT